MGDMDQLELSGTTGATGTTHTLSGSGRSSDRSAHKRFEAGVDKAPDALRTRQRSRKASSFAGMGIPGLRRSSSIEGNSGDKHGSFGKKLRSSFLKGKGQMKHMADMIQIPNKNDGQDGLTSSGRRTSRRASISLSSRMLETSMQNMEQELLEAENADLRRDRSSADGKGLSPIENQYKVIEKNTLYSFFVLFGSWTCCWLVNELQTNTWYTEIDMCAECPYKGDNPFFQMFAPYTIHCKKSDDHHLYDDPTCVNYFTSVTKYTFLVETVKIVNFFGLNLWQVGLNMNYHIYMLELERLLEDQIVKQRVYWKLMLQLIQIPGKRTAIFWQTAAIMCSPIPFVDFYFRSAGGLSDWDPKVTYYFDSFLFFLVFVCRIFLVVRTFLVFQKLFSSEAATISRITGTTITPTMPLRVYLSSTPKEVLYIMPTLYIMCIGYIHHSLEFSTNYWPTDRRCMEDWDQHNETLNRKFLEGTVDGVPDTDLEPGGWQDYEHPKSHTHPVLDNMHFTFHNLSVR
mmetsp:Transcript_79419/g.226821  ORF Transcript_79419/g.226821 Transcript_79419/m.226821 type:complete len:514 (+) Transcript_79419:481-2022(+)